MFDLWRAAKARRSAARTIRPLVDLSRQRIGAIPDEAWRAPYMIGFLGMLITLVAERETDGRIGSEGLALAQLEAWSDITGISDDLVGEDMCLLSANDDPDFQLGCNNARRFMSVFTGVHDPADPEIAELYESNDLLIAQTYVQSPEQAGAFGKGGDLAAAMWSRFFDECVC